MPVGFKVPDIAGSFIAGRQARQQEDYGNTRNAMAQMELEQQPRETANRNAMFDRQQQQYTEQQQQQALTQAKATAEHIATRPDAKAFAQGQFPAFVQMAEQRLGARWDDLSDNDVQRFATDIAQQSAAKLGQGPAARPVQYQDVDGPDGSILQRDPTTQQLKQVVGRQPNVQMVGNFKALSPAEIEAAGLPAGTSAQRDINTGKIDVLSKRDQSASLSQKDSTVAKIKLNSVKLARQQLNAIKEAFAQGKGGAGPNAFGPGQGLLPTQAGKLFDSRVDQMRSTLTALTRTPGVGSMSDYESKLDQSKFPKRGDYESVTGDKLQQLDDMLSLIEGGYTQLLGGGATEAAAAQPQPAQQQQRAPAQAEEYLKSHPELRGAFRQKYGYLPDG